MQYTLSKVLRPWVKEKNKKKNSKELASSVIKPMAELVVLIDIMYFQNADICVESFRIMCNATVMCNVNIFNVQSKLHIHINVLTTHWDGINPKSHQLLTEDYMS